MPHRPSAWRVGERRVFPGYVTGSQLECETSYGRIGPHNFQGVHQHHTGAAGTRRAAEEGCTKLELRLRSESKCRSSSSPNSARSRPCLYAPDYIMTSPGCLSFFHRCFHACTRFYSATRLVPVHTDRSYCNEAFNTCETCSHHPNSQLYNCQCSSCLTPPEKLLLMLPL